MEITQNVFNFINNTEKIGLLTLVNEKLNINKYPNNKLVFVYSAPKVGSTSIISSFCIIIIFKSFVFIDNRRLIDK